MAAVPGAIFHGAGHWYAGDKKTGRILLLSELFGLALMSFDRTSGSVTQRIGNREEERGGGGVSAIGRVLFFGSWLYDLGAAGDAARKTNRKRLRQGLEVQLVPEPEGRRVSFNPRARYTVRF